MNKRAGETTIKTSIRIRPCSQQERETYPGPCPVHAVPGEVRLFQRPFIPSSGRNSPSNVLRSPRPGTPTSPHATPRGPSSPSMVWRQQAAVQAQLGNDYQSYPFANVFGPEEDSEEVYNGSGCRDVVGAVLGGCNGTIFVYGQTGAGKTFTMDAVTDLVLQQLYAEAAEDSSSEVAITVSAVELYNEVLRCLLSGRENLQLRWASGAGSVNGVVLEGADERPCGSIEEAAALVTMAKASRAVGETRANARSSRSHLIVRIKVEVLQLSSMAGGPPSPVSSRRASLAAAKGGRPPPATVSFSMLNLVDLAGSERIDKTGSSDTPLRLREALNINKSLLCLGNVVTALAERAEGKRASHIPYRDSKLTRLLEDSLGGNATTALIACITPLPEWHLEQSRSTLEFAARAARIVCKPQRNVLNLAPSGPASGEAANIIASLQAEVEALKKQLAEQQQQPQLPQSPMSPQPPQLHALPVQPVSSNNALWDGCGIFTSRGSGGLAGVAENAAETGDTGSAGCSPSPGSASCPTSPNGRHSPLTRGRSGGWTNRLRMSLGGGNPAGQDSAPGSPTSPDSTSRGSIFRSVHHIPSRIPTPRHSLFASLTSPRASSKSPATAPIDPSMPDAPAAAIQTCTAQQAEHVSSIEQPALPASAHTTSIISRASGTQKSLLWKLLQQPHGHHDRMQSEGLNRISSGNGSTHSSHGATSTQSLKSTGLLITSSSNAATAAAAVAANAVGVLARWATFSGSRSSPISSATVTVPADRAETHDGRLPCHTSQLQQQLSGMHTGRSSIASRRLTTDGATGISSNALVSGAAAKQVLDSITSNPSLESRVSAAEAAMSLRDHIIKQLVLALQQKKAEIRSLKEQLAAVLKQLESSEGEEQVNKAKLRELAEGIQMLAAARQEEFEKWKGHLVGLEAALQSAQKEATNYRDESQSLVQQLAELQARYDTLQTEQRNSLVNIPMVPALHSTFSTHQQEQLSDCLTRLQAIEASLQQMLRNVPDATPAGTRRCTPRAGTPSPRQMQEQHPEQEQRPAAPAGDLLALLPLFTPGSLEPRSSSKGDVPSHCIQTVTTRVYEAGVSPRLALSPRQPTLGMPHSLAKAAEDAAAAAKLSHVEFVLAELQELMPLVKAAAGVVLQPHASRAVSGSHAGHLHAVHALNALGGNMQRLSVLQTGGTADNVEGKQQDQAVQTKEAKASLAGAAGLLTASKCHKCDSLKPLLIILQKLKDEVVVLKAAVRTRDAQLTAAEETSAGLKADLLESKQQVGALRERIDELSEDLEAARTAAATAAAAAAAAPCTSDATSGSALSVAEGPSRPQSPGHELSRHEVSCKQVPLMGENTPLEALHAQILQSWQALAMPFAYRSAFVLGASDNSSSFDGSTGNKNNSHNAAMTAAERPSAMRQAPWLDRVQCQAHIALLACLHQYHEDEPGAAQQQQEVLDQESRVVEAGLAQLPVQHLAGLLQRWGVPAEADPPAQRAALLAKLWAPGSTTTAEVLAADSAAACQLALQAAPSTDLAAVSLRCNASIIAAASNALADAAS